MNNSKLVAVIHDNQNSIVSTKIKTRSGILYPLLLALLFLADRQAIAGEIETLRSNRLLSTFILDGGASPLANRANSPLAPVNAPSAPPTLTTQPLITTIDPRYLIAPRMVKLKDVNSRTTQVRINGIKTVHQSQSEFTTGIESGSNRNTTVNLNGIKLFSPYVEESISRDRVYRIEYTNSYNQIQTLRQQRDISTTVVEPQTIMGMREQISLIGDCLPSTGANTLAAKEKQQCVYIPGILTDNTSIDPEKLVPTRIIQGSKFGEVVTPASLAAIKQPGFQTGANGQQFGVDLYFPRVGTTDGNNTNSTARVERREEQINTPSITTGSLQQVLVSNGDRSGISRTIRGLTLILNDRNTVLNSSLQLVGTVLGNAEPQLPQGKSGRSVTINPNLILAANNTRVPDNSFTAYSAGWGYGYYPQDDRSKLPAPVNYNAVWFGLSPVVDRQVSTDTTFRNIGTERIKVYSGGEGGAQSSVSSVVGINNSNFSSANIGNAYSQIYLTLFDRDADRVNTTRLRESTDYYPHLSLTGNITTHDSVLRYYTGAIVDLGLVPRRGGNYVKAYTGADFNQTTPGGFSYDLAAIGYLNPDPEYYSRISANASQKINLGRNPAYNLVLNTGLNYAIDGATEFDRLKFRSGNSSINTGIALNLGDVSLGTTYFLPNGMPNSIDSLLSTNITWRVKDNILISGYYTPINKNSPKSPLGVSAAVKFGKEYNSPSLVFNWSQNDTSFGQSIAGNQLSTSDNIFGVFFRFGEPLNTGK